MVRSRQQTKFQAQVTTLSAENSELKAQLQTSQEQLEQTRTLLEESQKKSKQEQQERIRLLEAVGHGKTIERLKGEIQTIEKEAESQRQMIWVRDEQVHQQSVRISKLEQEKKDRDGKIEGFKRAWEAMSGVMK